MTPVEHELIEHALATLEAKPDRQTICGAIVNAQYELSGRRRNADARWNWPTARSMELDAASHELRKSIMRALNKNSIGVGIATLEWWIEHLTGISVADLIEVPEHAARIRQTRINWVRHMLETW
jgi:hypothetical protein